MSFELGAWLGVLEGDAIAVAVIGLTESISAFSEMIQPNRLLGCFRRNDLVVSGFLYRAMGVRIQG